MRDYLQSSMKQSGTPLHMVVLENEEATRLNIVRKFEKHLNQAQEGDIAFFYYSGHGSQEKTHELFYEIEEDKKNETLVCYDSRSQGGMDLADKELVTLIDMVSQSGAHFLTILDCCNSGSGTRDLNGNLPDLGRTKSRLVEDAPKRVRGIDDYILPRETAASRGMLNLSEPEQMVMPNPRQVTLSAAQSFQLAKETYLGGSPRGVFTYSLLEVLQNSVGPLTYADVMRRVRSLVLERTFDQNPQLYATETGDLSMVFLDGANIQPTNYYALEYDREEGWKLDVGALHGIIQSSRTGGKTVLNVFAEDASESEMSKPDMALGKVEVTDVFPTYSLVRPTGSLFLDKKTVYRSRIWTMAVQALGVFYKGHTSGIEHVKQAIANDHEGQLYLKESDHEGLADYIVDANEHNGYSLRRQTDAPHQPLTTPIVGLGAPQADQLVDQLVHIAHWERILDLSNPGSNLFSESVKIEILPPEEDTPLNTGIMGATFRYSQSAGKAGRPRFRVRIVNTSQERLYVSLLYLSANFEVNTNILPQGGIWLEPRQSTWVNDGRVMSVKVEDDLFVKGKPEVRQVFKVLFCNREFSTLPLNQEELGKTRQTHPNPHQNSNSRGLVFGDESSFDMDDWNANQISLTILRED